VPVPPPRRAFARAAVVFALLLAVAGCSGDEKKIVAKDAGPAPVGKPATAPKQARGKPAANISPQ
jgi:hypothetical protein